MGNRKSPVHARGCSKALASRRPRNVCTETACTPRALPTSGSVCAELSRSKKGSRLFRWFQTRYGWADLLRSAQCMDTLGLVRWQDPRVHCDSVARSSAGKPPQRRRWSGFYPRPPGWGWGRGGGGGGGGVVDKDERRRAPNKEHLVPALVAHCTRVVSHGSPLIYIRSETITSTTKAPLNYPHNTRAHARKLPERVLGNRGGGKRGCRRTFLAVRILFAQHLAVDTDEPPRVGPVQQVHLAKAGEG